MTIYTPLALALTGGGLVLLRLLGWRRGLALAVLAPVLPLIALRLSAHAAVTLLDRAANSCGPLTRLWRWAAAQLASGGRT